LVTALAVGIVSTLSVLAFFMGVYVVVERPGDISHRLEAYATIRRAADDRVSGRRGFARLLERIDRLMRGQAVARRLALRLAQANIRMTVPEFVVIDGSLGVVFAALGFVLRQHIVSAVATGVVGLAVPWLLLEWRRQKRIKAFHDQLIDVLTLVVGSLRGGHALLTALDLVSKELGAPASEEFERVLREIGFGLSQSEALNNLVARMETDDLQLIVTAVNISHEVGGNLSLVLEKITETLRERIRLQGEIRVLTTQQRLTSYVLAALPFVLAIVLGVMNPGWMMQLFQPGWVRLIPLVAVVSDLIGFVIAQMVTRIEV
jgi:tight adherence protein B